MTNKIHLMVSVLFAAVFAFFQVPNAQTRAFIGAEGFGALANGWRSPDAKILFVTNLNDTGAGSFRQAYQYEAGPRYIVFLVGGYIPHRQGPYLTNKDHGNVYVAGQTAPGDGITLKGETDGAPQAYDGLYIQGEQTCVRYLRVRCHNGSVNSWACGLWGASQAIVDHCSFSYAQDDQIMIMSKLGNITVQKCISSDPCYNGGKAVTMGYDHGPVSMHHNLLSDAKQRSPLLGYGAASEFTNNLIYNWGGIEGLGAEIHNLTGGIPEPTYDLISNYYVWGPNSGWANLSGWDDPTWGYELLTKYGPGTLYLKDNKALLPQASGGYVPIRVKNEGSFSLVTAKLANPAIPVTVDDISTQAKADAWAADLLADVGCTKPKRDACDQFLIQGYSERRKGLDWPDRVDYEYDTPFAIANGGNPWPALASGTPTNLQPSGMTQEFITRHGLSNTVASALSTSISDARGQGEAYQNIEWCLMEQAGDIPGGPVSVRSRPSPTGKSITPYQVKKSPLDIFGRTINQKLKKTNMPQKIMDKKLGRTK